MTYDLALYYDRGGLLRTVIWGTWEEDGNGVPLPASYTALAAREFAFDSPRARYLDRDVDPDSLFPLSTMPERWTDCGNGIPLGDFCRDLAPDPNDPNTIMNIVTEATLYCGTAKADLDPNGRISTATFPRADMLGSATLETDANGTVIHEIAYSAFGLTTAGMASSRYAFGGEAGYESGLISFSGANVELTALDLLHVGARWYQPGTGRFVQRDPSGVAGGLNVYAYGNGNPTIYLDPDGTKSLIFKVRGLLGGWVRVSEERAASCVRNGGDALVQGGYARSKSKSMGNSMFGNKNTHHQPHKGYTYPHYQHKNGSSSGFGHLFYEILDCIAPPVLVPDALIPGWAPPPGSLGPWADLEVLEA